MKKIICLVLTVCLSSVFLIGCTTAETELWNAYIKNAEASSYAMDMSMKLSVDTSEVEDEATLEFLKYIDDVAMNLSGNVISDVEKGSVKAELDIDATVMGEDYNFKLWLNVDMSDAAAPVFEYIYQLDNSLVSSLGLPNVQYYLFDMSEMIADSDVDLSSYKMFDIKQIMDSLSEMDTTGINVEKEGDTFNVSLNNDTFNSLIKQYFDIILSNPAFVALYPEEQKVMFDEMLENFSKINLLGDEGINVSYTINSDGYIEAEKSDFDIVIDPAQISEAFGMGDAGTTDKFVIGIELESKYFNYNSVEKIEFPVLTSENSLNLFDMMKGVGDITYEHQDGISVFVNEKRVEFDVPPQLVDGRTMVPMRAIFESLGATVEFDEETNTITSIAGEKEITHTIGENIIYVDDVVFEMDVVSFVTDGRTLVPARFISEALGANVDWIEQVETVVITLD